MTEQKFDVNRLRIASPCSASWATMAGDERRRFCDLCQLNVYNFSEMTAAEVEKLVAESEGRICGRLYKRADGTILTKECPVGFRAYQKRAARFAGAALTAVLGLFSVSFGQKTEEKSVDAASVKIVRTFISAKASSLTGTVTDENGAVIPGVEVVLTNGDKDQISVITNSEGFYSISSITKGIYALRIKSQRGFEAIEVKNIEIKENEKLELDLNPKISEEAFVIGVTASGFVLDLPLEEIRKLPINERPIEQLPVNKKP